MEENNIPLLPKNFTANENLSIKNKQNKQNLLILFLRDHASASQKLGQVLPKVNFMTSGKLACLSPYVLCWTR